MTRRTMHMTGLEPRTMGGLQGFGFTVTFTEPASAADQSTAARKDVPGPLPVIENHPQLSVQGDGYPHKDGGRSPDTEVGSLQSQVAGTPAGTQAQPVDTHSIANDDFKRIPVIGWIE